MNCPQGERETEEPVKLELTVIVNSDNESKCACLAAFSVTSAHRLAFNQILLGYRIKQ